MLGTILFALLWLVLGVVATFLGGVAFLAYCDHHGAYDNLTEEEMRKGANEVRNFANNIFPKK